MNHICIVWFAEYYTIFLKKILLEDTCFTMLCWVSAICQHESATGIHMFPPSWIPLPHPSPSYPSRLSQSTVELPESYCKCPLAICFKYGSVYVSMLFSPFVPPSPPPPPTVSPSLVSVHCCPASSFLSTIFLDSMYMCLTCDIWFSDLLHLV